MTNLKNNLVQFLVYHLFQILKKAYLQILKKTGPIFCLSPFQILQRVHLQILKTSGPLFCFSPFSNIKKGLLKNLKKTWSNFLLINFFKY